VKVIINAAMTIDGKIATASGDSAISSKEDWKRVHKVRAASDAIMVGISTVLVDDPRLTVRHVRGRNPARIIVDSKGRIPSRSRILRSAHEQKTLIAVSEQAKEADIIRIKKTGALVIVAGRDTVDLKALFLFLKKAGFKHVLVEGGGELNWSVLDLGLADELVVTVAPRVAGGRLATTLVEGDGYDRISQGPKLALMNVERTRAGELVLHYRVGKHT
jgi:2,5-diamino-6-(ribosylamino)-4(3H)-pyrimidinone 5'-phosphate reductase